MRTNTFAGRIFDGFNYLFLTFCGLVTILPFIYLISGSFATNTELTQKAFFLIPSKISFNAYQYIFATNTFLHSFYVSVYITVMGTLINLLFTTTMAYALSRKGLLGRNLVMNLVIFSMVFSGGMIPTYLLVKGVGMLDTFWAMMVPGAISAFNLIIMKNFFQEIPQGLMESASIDGCTDIGIFFRIVLPLSKPILATIGLFYAVGHWDDYTSALLYISDAAKWPMQMMLQQIVMTSQSMLQDPSAWDPTYVKPPDQSIKMAVIVVSTVPILLVYPFIQKHFTKGVLIGAIKG